MSGIPDIDIGTMVRILIIIPVRSRMASLRALILHLPHLKATRIRGAGAALHQVPVSPAIDRMQWKVMAAEAQCGSRPDPVIEPKMATAIRTTRPRMMSRADLCVDDCVDEEARR